jgi:hypothetical protein
MTAEEAIREIHANLEAPCAPDDFDGIARWVQFLRMDPHGAYAIRRMRSFHDAPGLGLDPAEIEWCRQNNIAVG